MSTLSKKKVIGITGSMGSGKSEVVSILKKKYPVIDCDKINAQLLEKGEEGYNQLIQLDWIVLDENKNIDKKEMASQMFASKSKKETVESILHPLIFERINQWVSIQSSPLVFVEVPLLFEIKAQSHFDRVWCVVCDEKTALNRLMTYRNFTIEQARARLAHQLDPAYKSALSDTVIENNGTLEQLEQKVLQAIERE